MTQKLGTKAQVGASLFVAIGVATACASKLPEGKLDIIDANNAVTTGDGDGDDVVGDGDGGDGDGTPVERNDATCLDSPKTRFRKLRPEGVDHQAALDAMTEMTVDQKIAMLSGGQICPFKDCDFDATGVPALGIKDFRLRDGPRGVHTADGTKATTFAVPAARGASFDTDLEMRIGQATGREMAALNLDLMLAPQVNTIRHPRWARAQESYSEDPVVLGKFGAAYTRGVQEYVPACPKHFAANNTDENRETMSANVDEQTLRENYTRAFKIVVEEADPACIMASYNRVNSIHSTENEHLLTDILRTDWNWEGFVISDWWASTPQNGAESLNAGLDLEMPDESAFVTLQGALDDGDVTGARIDEAALRILNVRARFGQLEPGYNEDPEDASLVDDPAHKALARESAEKGAVLLKNEGEILPISDSVGSILVMGPDALVPITDTITEGIAHGLGDRGSSNTYPPYAVSYLDGITARAGQAGVSVGHSVTPSEAAGADLIIIPVTMKHEDEGEAFGGGGDRDDLTLGGGHPTHWQTKPTQFINQVAAVNPNVVVLIATGSAVIVEDWIDSAPGIVHTFYPGQEAGNAVANLLFGDVNFSAKLPFTVARNEADYPIFGNASDNVTMDYLHGYRKFDTEALSPRYWFGHGLSYTTFEYSDFEILCDSISADGAINAVVNVTNTGTVAGDEVVMAFIGYPNTRARRPNKEIKQWRRTGMLAPGDTAQVFFSIPVRELAYWGDAGWQLEMVEHSLIVAPTADPADPKKLELPVSFE